MKKVFIILSLIFMVTASSVNANPKTFKDTKNHWAAKYITGASDKGYVSGYTDGTFKPNNEVTYGEFASMIVKLAARDSNIKTYNSDWASGYMTELYSNKVISKQDLKRSNEKMTRGNMALISQRYMKARFDMKKADKISTLTDLDSMSHATREAVETLWSLGLIKGDENNRYNHNNNVTRAEACVVIMNLHSWVDKRKRGEI